MMTSLRPLKITIIRALQHGSNWLVLLKEVTPRHHLPRTRSQQHGLNLQMTQVIQQQTLTLTIRQLQKPMKVNKKSLRALQTLL
jgi:cell division inhibitor SulA